MRENKTFEKVKIENNNNANLIKSSSRNHFLREFNY